MSTRKRCHQKGRRESGSFVAIPRAVLLSPNWRRCSGTAIKLLIDLAGQYKGCNNGDLSPALVKDGPASEAKTRALRELCHYGLLLKTKHGGLMRTPSLYALTWYAIDGCGGKLEVAATVIPPGDWKCTQPDFKNSQVRRSKLIASKNEVVTPISKHPSFDKRIISTGFIGNSTSKSEDLLRSTKQGFASRREFLP